MFYNLNLLEFQRINMFEFTTNLNTLVYQVLFQSCMTEQLIVFNFDKVVISKLNNFFCVKIADCSIFMMKLRIFYYSKLQCIGIVYLLQFIFTNIFL